MKTLIFQGSHTLVYGCLFLIAGVWIRYMIAGRRFRRRGVAGLQHFKSYGRAVLTTFMERLFNLIAILLIIFAIILMVFS
jgi:hypothetical protein